MLLLAILNLHTVSVGAHEAHLLIIGNNPIEEGDIPVICLPADPDETNNWKKYAD